MRRSFTPLLAGLALLPVQAVLAQTASAQTAQPAGAEAPAVPAEPSHAAGVDLYYSSDAEDTEVVKAGLNLDLHYAGREDYFGIRLEKAWFDPLGQGKQSRERAYLRYADGLGGGWKANVLAGTDGHTILGAASVHNEARFRQEYFIEREQLETPQGLARGLYYTFAGAALDLPVDDRNSFTLVAGLQEFTGKNVRTHLRGTFVHVLKSDWGLSAQLRTRYFRSSDPGEYDYYSPHWYAEVLPILQIRRFSGGWRYSAAAGIGAQRDSESDWRRSLYFNAQATSPAFHRNWALNAGLTYSNTPVTTGDAYGYMQFTLSLMRAF